MSYVVKEPTAITDVTNTNTEVVKTGIYDIMGRKLSAPQKGFNIINGKKVIIK